MHDVVVKELEEYLEGRPSPAVQTHLRDCGDCRTEVGSMAGMSEMLAGLRPEPGAGFDADAGPSPFFYTRVTTGIVRRQNTEHWGLLAPGAAFFRRVAFASLVVLACLGSYLVMSQNDVSSGTDAAAIMAQHDVTVDHAASSDRSLMLVTLASYGQ